MKEPVMHKARTAERNNLSDKLLQRNIGWLHRPRTTAHRHDGDSQTLDGGCSRPQLTQLVQTRLRCEHRAGIAASLKQLLCNGSRSTSCWRNFWELPRLSAMSRELVTALPDWIIAIAAWPAADAHVRRDAFRVLRRSRKRSWMAPVRTLSCTHKVWVCT